MNRKAAERIAALKAQLDGFGHSWRRAPERGIVAIVPNQSPNEPDESQEALRNVEKITDSEPVSGEEPPSDELLTFPAALDDKIKKVFKTEESVEDEP